MVSSSAAGVLGRAAHGRANDSGSTPRWREPGWRTFSMKAAEIRPPELTDEMAALALVNDAGLWRVARRVLSSEKQEQLDTLLQKRGRGELRLEEQPVLDELLSEYEHVILARAHAAVLLKQRGYDVSD
jgi:hypothetical protein